MITLISLFAAATGQGATAGPVDSVEITVYNQNFGLVKEIRHVDLKQGQSVIAVKDVAATIDPTTVHFKSLDDPQGVEILEQNFRFDLLGPNSILEKSVGKKVRLHRTLPDGKKEVLEGTLLTPPSQGTVIHTTDGRFILSPAGEVEVLELPEGLIAKPTLFWDVHARKAGRQRAELSYMCNDINWIADYVATLDAKDQKLDLAGWVTLTNRTGVTFKEAKLKLVAGDVRRAQPMEDKQFMLRGAGRPTPEAAVPGFTESQLFEYYLYTLGRPTTIADKEIKQVSLLSAAGVPVTKKLIYEGQGFYWRIYGRNYRPGDGIDTDPNQKVNVVVEVVNSEANRLGMPLPKGRVRVYKQDIEGQLQFVGEDTIDHTPRDEKIKLYIGDAFDVVCTRSRTDYRRISEVIEQSFEIVARNRKKDEMVTLIIAEHPWGEWEILEKSHDYTKVDAHTIHFTVDIPAGKEVKVAYRVRSKF